MDSQLTLPHAARAADPLELLTAENRILELATRNTPLPEVLEVLASSAEELVRDGSRCSILLLDEDGRRLLHGAAPNLPTAYNEKIHGIEIGPGVGSCGTAACTGIEVIVSDIATHPYWAAFKDLAMGFGLRACWSTPILSSKSAVLGTFAIYYGEPFEPDANARNVVQMLSRTAALVIERARLNEQLNREIAQHIETEALLRTAQQAARLATWRWNLDDDTLIFAPGSADIFAEPLAAIGDREAFLAQVHPEDRARVRETSQRLIEQGQDYQLEFRVRAGSGATRWVLSTCRPVRDEDGVRRHVVGVSADITQRKQSEDALRDSEKLAATGRLAATIAHEINNPLEAVTNFIFLAKGNKELPPPVRRHLDIADQELARVTHIAQQTLGFYRDTTAPVRMDMATMLDDVLLVYQRKLSYKSIKLLAEYDPGLYMNGYRGELRQVFSNLIANAIDACGDEDCIHLRARYAKNPWIGTREVRVTIADSGCGMAEEVQARLFSPFFTTKQEIGTGLGLWVTQGIVTKHHGRIRYRTATGRRHGTVFTVVLPVDAVGGD